jgi:hypothetical protein
MSHQKLQHYVPQFYLNYFIGQQGRFWVWNKVTRSAFYASPHGVAAETHFYRVPEFIGTETDPLFLEKELSKLEGSASQVLKRWLKTLKGLPTGGKLLVSQEERLTIALFLSVQFLRTAEQKGILADFTERNSTNNTTLCDDERTNLHARLLCASGLVEDIAERVYQSIWIFAKNTTSTPFWTSDNPVCFKTGDNQLWLKSPGVLSTGTYVVFPINPRFVLYCKEPTHWADLRPFDCRVSPVVFTPAMVEHENAGQVFMATRFVISPDDNFTFAEDFVDTIGSDLGTPSHDETR